jgi:hypothetical protein
MQQLQSYISLSSRFSRYRCSEVDIPSLSSSSTQHYYAIQSRFSTEILLPPHSLSFQLQSCETGTPGCALMHAANGGTTTSCIIIFFSFVNELLQAFHFLGYSKSSSSAWSGFIATVLSLSSINALVVAKLHYIFVRPIRSRCLWQMRYVFILQGSE